MTKELVKVSPGCAEVGGLAVVADTAREYIKNSRAGNTQKAYRSDWNDFMTWCRAHSLGYLPALPDTIVLYLTDLAETCKASTITRRVSAISQAHSAAGWDTPTKTAGPRSVLAGIRRTKGTAPETKSPAVVDDVRAMLAALPDNLLGTRDRALLSVGFSGAFRRSELVALNVEDLNFTKEGVVITLTRSKTDQEGEGRKVAIPSSANPSTCPVRALREWLAQAGITTGAVFQAINRHGQIQPGRLSDKAVALVVKRQATKCGMDASKFAGHSLRAGLATSAAIAGASERSIMNQTGHKSTAMVRRYIRDGNLFRENAAGKVGL